MGEPWLESLSDDWNASSVSPPSAPSTAQSHAPSNVTGQTRASRIPRYVSPQKNVQPEVERKRGNQTHILQERKDSDNNTDQPLASTAPHPGPKATTLTSKTTTLSSLQSVIKHAEDSNLRNVPGRMLQQPSTPMWKARALQQQDLFSPAGLEGIFQKPSNDERSSPNKQSLSFYNDLSHMPSSPPPWLVSTQKSDDVGVYDIDAQIPTDLTTLFEHDKIEVTKPPILPTRTLARSANESVEYSIVKGSPVRHPTNESTVNELVKLGHQTPLPPSSSSGTDGFSPVYVSKHNTVDGRVDYAPFDPTVLPKLSEHVNTQRGLPSEDDSFENRPLSPSMSSSALPSDSLAPSDSVSQVRVPFTTSKLDEPLAIARTTKQKETKSSVAMADESKASEKVMALLHTEEADEIDRTSNAAYLPNTMIERELASPGPSATFADTGSIVHNPHLQTLSKGNESVEQQGAEDLQKPVAEGRSASVDSIRTIVTSLDQHHRPQSVAGRKRKDAKYDNDQASSDASAIAIREILRPRNPTPWQSQRRHARSTSSFQVADPGADEDNAPTVQQVHSLLAKPTGTVKARALALEAATFSQRRGSHQPVGARKKSVSTQDYLKEAMRIMDLIRARKQAATSDWSSNTGEEFEADPSQDTQQDASMQSLARPPSRDGPPSGWRTRQMPNHVDPRIENQLRKYEETGDESFLVSSIVRSVRITEECGFQHEQHGFRITDNPHRGVLRSNSDPGHAVDDSQLADLGASRSSNGNTDGSEETHKTTSTQKISSIGRIPPETATHLIRDEEAGMRFDTQRQTWVKCKVQRALSSSTKVPSSSAATEDDPLGEIPDLSVHEPSHAAPSTWPAHVQSNLQAYHPSSKRFEKEHMDIKPASASSAQDESHKKSGLGLDEERVMVTRNNVSAEEDSILYKQKQPFANGRQPEPSTMDVPVQTVEEGQTTPEEDDDVPSLPRPKGKHRRREQSVLFSSPPVSREWEAKHWTDSTDQNHDNDLGNVESLDPDDSCLAPWGAQRTGISASQRRQRHLSRNVSMSHSEQHQEISFIEQRPDGRTFSLSMSVSTPLPSRQRHASGAILPPSGLRKCSFMDSLSPLSDFSVANDDGRHVRNHALSRPVEVVERRGRRTARSALATNDLVEKLTMAEPDEPYWDFMHRLSLTAQGVETLNMLDEFCPRLEELNASDNNLQHVDGAPVSLRHLDLSQNHLSSLTDMSHLYNLQYLHLSHNRLNTLTGLGSLIHLRELDLANNQVDSVEGIFDLDGLISVNLQHNCISTVDFSTAQIPRLRTLNLSHNNVFSIKGLSSLSALELLDLEMNQLSQWPASPAEKNASLHTLMLNGNSITAFDISGFSSLHTLSADDNNIENVADAPTHSPLHTLQIRNQSLAVRSTLSQLNNAQGVTDLYVSGTSVAGLLPLSVPFLNLRILDISFTGLQTLPSDFGTLVPNLRVLNLNANNIKDLRPLEGIVGLQKLLVAQNGLSRLRNFVKVLSRLGSLLKGGGILQEVDVRGNPLAMGFYAGMDGSLRMSKSRAQVSHTESESIGLMNLVPEQHVRTDELHMSRMDGDMKMKRRIYEMLVGSKCPKLTHLDGLPFQREELSRRDDIWDRLVELGVVRKVD